MLKHQPPKFDGELWRLENSIGKRIEQVRGKLTQVEFAPKIGVSKNTVGRIERNEYVPDGDILLALRREFGVSPSWVLTGEGLMLQADYIKPGGLDMDRLRLAIETVEEGLAATRTTMAPTKKADLALAVYELLEEPGVSKERVLKLVKFAA